MGHVAHVWGDRPLEAIATGLGRLGYVGAEFFDHRVNDYLERPGALRELLGAHGVQLASLYLEGSFMVPETAAEEVERAGRWAAFVAELDCRQLVLGPGWQTPEAAPRYEVLCQTLNRIGQRTLEHGVQACFHPHMGSAIQDRAQIGRVFDHTDPSLVFFCLDTGHVAKGGSDVLELYATYGARIPYVHLKDLDDEGRFCEMGKGRLDFPALFRALRQADYRGWVLPEVPVNPASGPTAEAVAAYDLAYLRCELLPRWRGEQS